MSDDYLDRILGALRSQTRRRILELLLDNSHGLRFSEIGRTLNVYPSTLEKHLTRLVKDEVIAHESNRYMPTLNSGLIWKALGNFRTIPKHPYFSNHTLLLDDENLQREFRSLNFDVITDIISIVNRIKEDFEKPQNSIQAGGAMDHDLGKGIYGSGMLSHKDVNVEIILTTQLIDEIQGRGEETLFLSQFDTKKTSLFSVEDCDFGLGVGDDAGLLFLPRLDFTVDFHQCLYSHGPNEVAWLKKLFKHLKKQSRPFIL